MIAEKSVNALGTLGRELVEKRQNDFITDILDKLNSITLNMIDKDLSSARIAVNEIGKIGTKAADGTKTVDDTLESIVMKSLKVLVELGKRAVKQESPLLMLSIIQALRDGGVKTVEKRLENATREYKSGLTELMEIEGKDWPIVDSAIEEALQTIEKAEKNSSNNI